MPAVVGRRLRNGEVDVARVNDTLVGLTNASSILSDSSYRSPTG